MQTNVTIFIDDDLPNVEGATAVGRHSVQFKDVAQCVEEVKEIS